MGQRVGCPKGEEWGHQRMKSGDSMGQRVGCPKDEEWVPQRAKSGDSMGQRVGTPKGEEGGPQRGTDRDARRVRSGDPQSVKAGPQRAKSRDPPPLPLINTLFTATPNPQGGRFPPHPPRGSTQPPPPGVRTAPPSDSQPHRHSCSTCVLVQLRQLTWQHQWKVQLQRSVTRWVRVRNPRPQQSSSQPSKPGEELLHARPAVPAVPIFPLDVQKLGDFSK